ncbi:MAG: peptidoglycan endopeptidase, partial [Pseudomonadota bacterium]
CGVALPRDSDMQFAWSGEAIEGWNEPEALQRNDLVFWKGHVGIMLNPDTILHANAHHMAVAYEPLAEAIERIAPLYGQPIGAKRVAIDPSARPEWLQT